MNELELKQIWQQEENIAHIKGWDFSHLDGRFNEEKDLPWNYRKIIDKYLKDEHTLLDYDTGGGEFLLSLNHPHKNTYATEGYKPNVALCKNALLPLGINFKECNNPSQIPFADETFDIIINRHGEYDPKEVHRLLKKDGILITEQVGSNNNQDLVQAVLPNTPKPFPHMNLSEQIQAFKEVGFSILEDCEAFKPIIFYDIGAFVWYARIIQWEFPDFSVEKCFDKLLHLQRLIEKEGKIQGTIHRFLLVAKK